MSTRTSRRRAETAAPDYERVEISTWAGLSRELESMSREWWLFRGQEDASWPMTSTLTRELERRHIPMERWSDSEMRAIRIFQRKAHLLLQRTPADLFEWVALMQHHGAPTRLLDFTWSPHVAAFFALDRARGPATIWCLRAKALPKFDASNRPEATRDRRLPPSLRPWNNDDVAARMLTNRHRTVVWGSPYHMNQRLVVQSGTFLVPGVLDDTVENIVCGLRAGRDALRKLVLNSTAREKDGRTLREKAMWRLYNMNITYESLFPGLDGLARSMNVELEV
jgi:hypothetical protein